MADELKKLYSQLDLLNIRLRGIEDDMNLKIKEGENLYKRRIELLKEIEELE